MDTLTLQRLILLAKLEPLEKLVGMVLALHLNKRAQAIRVRQKTLAAECGCSVSSVKRAIKGLVERGVFTSKRTGRAAVLVPKEPQAGGINSGIVESSPVTHLIAHPWSISKPERMPWEYDTTYSSLVEEKDKRDQRRFEAESGQRDKNGADL